jgi:hypothetical protein
VSGEQGEQPGKPAGRVAAQITAGVEKLISTAEERWSRVDIL